MTEKEMKKINRGPKVLDTFSKLISFIWAHHKYKFILMIVFACMGATVEIVMSKFLGILIDDYITPMIDMASPDFAKVLVFLAQMAVLFSFGVISAFGLSWMGAVISQRTLTDLRRELFSHMQNLPVSFTDSHSSGEIMGLYTNDLDAIVELINQGIPQGLSVIITVCSIFVVMCLTNIILTCFVIAYIFLIMFSASVISKLSNAQFRKNQSYFGKYNGFVEESIYAQKVIKVFSHEKESIKDFRMYVSNLRESANKANCYANIFMPLLANIGNLLYVVLVIVGIIFMSNKVIALSVGSLVTFLQFARSFTGPMSQISQYLNSLIRGASGSERIFRFLAEPVEDYSGNTSLVWAIVSESGEVTKEDTKRFEGAKAYWKREFSEASSQYVELRGDVRFFNVDFSYDNSRKILSDINLYAKPGQKIAFVGSTGAGKTTITSLINRFYDVSSGKITIDGINIKDIKKDELRKSIAVVLQDTHLFTTTIRENIRYGNLDASDKEVVRAAKIAHCDDFINMFPEGYDTKIKGTASELSEGQKQLLTIARAAIADPPILILDEATSSVDSASEKYVEEAMDEIMKGRTVFVIAHRLSTIQNASVIIVLEHGKIIERGSHEELLEKKGRYYQLYTGKVELE